MKRIFKENEFDKLREELLNEIYPFEGLNKYFYLGVSTILDSLDRYLESHDENSISKDELRSMIDFYLKANKKIDEYFIRLKKDRQ